MPHLHTTRTDDGGGGGNETGGGITGGNVTGGGVTGGNVTGGGVTGGGGGSTGGSGGNTDDGYTFGIARRYLDTDDILIGQSLDLAFYMEKAGSYSDLPNPVYYQDNVVITGARQGFWRIVPNQPYLGTQPLSPFWFAVADKGVQDPIDNSPLAGFYVTDPDKISVKCDIMKRTPSGNVKVCTASKIFTTSVPMVEISAQVDSTAQSVQGNGRIRAGAANSDYGVKITASIDVDRDLALPNLLCDFGSLVSLTGFTNGRFDFAQFVVSNRSFNGKFPYNINATQGNTSDDYPINGVRSLDNSFPYDYTPSQGIKYDERMTDSTPTYRDEGESIPKITLIDVPSITLPSTEDATALVDDAFETHLVYRAPWAMWQIGGYFGITSIPISLSTVTWRWKGGGSVSVNGGIPSFTLASGSILSSTQPTSEVRTLSWIQAITNSQFMFADWR